MTECCAFTVARRRLHVTVTHAAQCMATLVQDLRALEGCVGEGTLVSTWQDYEHRDAILAPMVTGAIPVTIELLHRLTAKNINTINNIDNNQ